MPRPWHRNRDKARVAVGKQDETVETRPTGPRWASGEERGAAGLAGHEQKWRFGSERHGEPCKACEQGQDDLVHFFFFFNNELLGREWAGEGA